MSTDLALQLDRDATSRGGTPGNLFAPKTLGTEDINWLEGVLQSSALQDEPSKYEEPWVYVAPDLYVTRSEYQRRFGDIDLDYYRQRMTPAIFLAFVRHLGAVPGSPDRSVW